MSFKENIQELLNIIILGPRTLNSAFWAEAGSGFLPRGHKPVLPGTCLTDPMHTLIQHLGLRFEHSQRGRQEMGVR
jgi:hypothetical protein